MYIIYGTWFQESGSKIESSEATNSKPENNMPNLDQILRALAAGNLTLTPTIKQYASKLPIATTVALRCVSNGEDSNEIPGNLI
ncbi:hypothetical protein ACLB2K_069402 [Fragaria x ananassa]